MRLMTWLLALIAATVIVISPSTSPPPAAAQGSEAEQAIVAVIEAFNYGMIEATARRDPTVVRDFLTDEFYQEMALQMRADWSAGLAAVDLVELEWGTISIRGDEAIAYTVETWAVILTNGTGGEFPPEINLYRVVLRDGEWKVDANEHPTSQL